MSLLDVSDHAEVSWITLVSHQSPRVQVYDFRNGVLPDGVMFSRATSALFRPSPNADRLEADPDEPRFLRDSRDDYYLLIEPASTNELWESETPHRLALDLAPAQPYTLSIEGEGAVNIFNEAGSLDRTLEERCELTFYTPDNDEPVIVEPSNGVERWQLERGTVSTSYIPSEEAPTSRAAETILLEIEG